MSDQSKQVALPAYLLRRLQAFRISQGENTTYLLRDKLVGKTHDLEPWQFFVLEVLPGCEEIGKLLAVFEDRFGRQLTEPEVLKFFGWLADNKLLDEASAGHPLLKPFTKQGYALEHGLVKPKSFEELATMMAPASAKPAADSSKPAADSSKAPPPPGAEPKVADDETLAAGVNEADNLDPRRSARRLSLINIRPALSLLLPVLAPLRWGVYLIPLLALSALMLVVRYAHLAYSDLSTLHDTTTLATHALFSLLTINIAVTLTQAFVAHNFRASVGPLSLGLRFGFFPRFMVQIGHTKQLSRRERMWLHGGPLLMRVFLFSLGVLVWYNLRDSLMVLSRAGLALAFLCGVNLLAEGGNPLVKGNAYHLLAAFMNEPYLRGKSYRAFMEKFRGGAAPVVDSNVLAGYALASFVYAYFVVLVIILIVGKFLVSLQLGGATIIVCFVLGAYLTVRTVKRFKMISTAYERSVQFERWRKRALPTEDGETKQVEPTGSRTTAYLQTAVVLTLLLLLFLPYPYDAGGHFEIYPSDRQVITTDIAGIVEEVNFIGGETVKKGTVLARVAATDLKSQITVFNAQIAAQQAVIRDLKLRPKPEEVTVAQRALELAQRRAKFSGDRVPRMERLFKERTISFEEFDAARKEYEVDAQEVLKREADLELAKVGVAPDLIKAEEAKLAALMEQRSSVEGKVARTSLRMPFDGNILTLHLNERLNSVLDKGQPFAVVEDTRFVTAEIQVPESEIGYVAVGAPIRAVPNAYFERVFDGKVQSIDRNVTVKPFGNVFKVIAVIDNKGGELKTGMSGYSKISGSTMPVWKAFSLAVVRFASVQIWSWIP
ncbi:HlyD family secretion protein [Aquabacterium sp.]|uniref:HlyD family secretion protein n=1 Tax=Aquabacterium sp. TaxID=1872578 RepID=UPI002CC10E6C|nr:efflux RND transporter periplasmic adaptor subunit [Aquabacterium sp.]HSW05271.1 efflux RND transporter periplasmic adaptor subunit [Aquabacterium sp.]